MALSSISFTWDYTKFPAGSAQTPNVITGFQVFEIDAAGANPVNTLTLPNASSPSTSGPTTISSAYTQRFSGLGTFQVAVSALYNDNNGKAQQGPSAAVTVVQGPPAPSNVVVA